MPTYGYKCTKCENSFEVVQKITESPISVCPECGGETRRIFYPVGIIFKGPGFHITDYCRPKNPEGETKPTPTTKPAGPKAAKDVKKEKEEAS